MNEKDKKLQRERNAERMLGSQPESFQSIIIPLIQRIDPRSLAEDICSVQPMTGEVFKAVQTMFDFRWEWELPINHRPVYSNDDITVLLIMGYKLTHGHNV